MKNNKCSYCGAPLNKSSYRCEFCGQISIEKFDINIANLNLNRKEITYKILKSGEKILIYTKKTSKNFYKKSKIIYKEYLSLVKNRVKASQDKVKVIYAKEQTKQILFRYLPIGAISITFIIIFSIILYKYNKVKNIQKLEETGIKQFNNKEYKKSIISFNKAMSLNPNKSRQSNIHLYRGRAYLQSSRNKLATIDLSKANMLSPNNHEILFYLGNSYYANNDFKKALKSYTKSIKIKDYRNTFSNRCYTNYALSQYKDAISDCTQSIESSSKENILTTDLSIRGQSKYYEKDYLGSITDFSYAIEKYSGDDNKKSKAYIWRARSYQKLNNKAKYCSDLRIAKEINKKSKDYNVLSKSQYFIDNCAPKVIEKKQSIKIIEDNTKKKQKKEDIQISEQAKYYLERIKSIYLKRTECKNAINLVKLLLPMYQSDKVYFYRAIAHTNCTNYQESINDYDKAINSSPNNSLYYNNRAVNKGNIKDYEGAIKDYTKAIEIKSSEALYFRNRGYAKREYNDQIGAIKDYEQAIKMSPIASDYKNIGIAKINLGKYIDAISILDKSIKMNNKEWESYLYRGIAKYELKDYSVACSDWIRYAKRGSYYSLRKWHQDRLKSHNYRNSTIFNLYKKYCK